MTIRLLPQALVNQIAAGEVVERPASVAKELIENALDAGATRLEISVDGGGRERIQVRDNGRGIARDELALALAAHATSKISCADDLERINSFGFRGEALCAIASVSHLTITSRAGTDADAWTIESKFGQTREPRPASGPPGTIVDVQGLFANVPARRKFLRTDGAETARVTEVVCNAALAHPSVAFRFTSAGRTILDLAPDNDRPGRIHAVFGDALGESANTVAADATLDDGMTIRVTGSICAPCDMRGVSRIQRFIVNGRPIVDRSLIHAVREAYRGLAEPSMAPVFVLFLDVDPTLVDVNVHPQKSEVRWRWPSQMHRAVYKAVQQSLRGNEPIADGSALLASSDGPEVKSPQAWTSWRRAATPQVDSPHAPRMVECAPDADSQARSPEATQAMLLHAPRAAVTEVLQVDSTWLVLAEEGAVVIVDQHALHERVMFEEIRSRVTSGDLASQRLLVPACAEVPPEALARLDDLRELFERLGIDAVEAGPRSIAIHAFPGFLAGRGVDAARFVADALMNEQLAAALNAAYGPAAKEAALADILDMMACKAAVKGGDRLSPQEIAHLLALRATTVRSSNCPHGRPTSVRIPLEEIEKRFGRR